MSAFISIPVQSADLSHEPERPFQTGALSFQVKIKDYVSSYAVLAVPVLPGEHLAVHAHPPVSRPLLTLTVERDVEFHKVTGGWVLRTPENAGSYTVKIMDQMTGEMMHLNLLVMRPLSELSSDGDMHGYQVGHYPQQALKGLSAYMAPKGLIEVTPELEEINVSPHFTLKQFLCKQPDGNPKYVLIQEKLVLKLEQLLAAVNQQGIRTDSFVVMSGYRTPSYNHRIGQGIYSRHQWGDAADIYIDVAPKDGVMDDINQDGQENNRDAAFLYQLIENYTVAEMPAGLVGGLGDYGANRAHGPFVHVDTRGYRARWGQSANRLSAAAVP